MRLINTTTYELEEWLVPKPYAILSHTWRDEEVLYAEFATEKSKKKKGYQKIKYLCTQASEHNLRYAWIDTVCIDKSSSAELSEAINSMFRWYADAMVCYVYLDDTDDIIDIQSSRWLTRGWTLQELIAPDQVNFFNKDWKLLGNKNSLLHELVRWTEIDQAVLEDPKRTVLVSAAARMKWAASRSTTRIEDVAYSLLGIFNVNMPLMYGEREMAFQRLQQEILRKYQDISILAFDRYLLGPTTLGPVLAPSPKEFARRPKVVGIGGRNYCNVTSHGYELRLRLMGHPDHLFRRAILPYRFEFDPEGVIVVDLHRSIPMEGESDNLDEFLPQMSVLHTIPYTEVFKAPFCPLLLRERQLGEGYNEYGDDRNRFLCSIRAEGLLTHGYHIIYAEPESGVDSWDRSNFVSEVTTYDNRLIRKFGFVHWLKKEAFIVMLADECVHGEASGAFISARMKPTDKGCDTWLRNEGMYSVVRKPEWYDHPFHLRQSSQVVVEYDGNLWERVDEGDFDGVRPDKRLSLESESSFSEISIKVDKLLDWPGWQDRPSWQGWVIRIEPDKIRRESPTFRPLRRDQPRLPL